MKHHNALEYHSYRVNVWIFNVVTVLVAIPLMDQCLYPFLRQFAPNMLKRFGLSYILLLCSVGLLCLYEILGHNVIHQLSKKYCMFNRNQEVMPMSAFWILIPVILAAIGEIFLKVTG
jgi:dipeptide/tripeptide permease